jgi:class 3 adenylate cyclase
LTRYQKIFVLLQLLCSTVIQAEVPNSLIEVHDDLVKKVFKDAVIYHDSNNVTTIQNILERQPIWTPLVEQNTVFDLAFSTTWVALVLNNSTATPITTYLEFNPVFLEYITLYGSDGRKLDQVGSRVESEVTYSFPRLKINVPPGKHTYYASVASRSSSLSMMIRSEKMQAQKDKFDLSLFCLVVGGLLMLIVYHVFIFTAFRNRTYIYYALFVSSCMLFTITFTSFHKTLLPDSLFGFELGFWWSAIAVPCIFLCIYAFSVELLGLSPLDSKYPRLAKCLTIFPASNILLIVALITTDEAFLLIPMRLTAVVQLICYFGIGFYLWLKNKNNRTALYYSISWIPFIIGGVAITGWLSGSLAHHDAYAWSIPIATLIQSILLSLVIGQKMDKLTFEKIRMTERLEVQVDDLKKRDRTIRAFAGSDIVNELDSGQDPLKYKPHNVQKSIIFLDMRGYTTFSETNTELQCHTILNEYFDLINKITYEHGGHVDKIIGDAMMIVYDDPKQCLKSVVSLRIKIAEKNTERMEKALSPLKFGFGISHGVMLSANFGSDMKLDRTLVGDTVNVASRLESITKELQADVLCTQEFIDQHPDYEYYRPTGYIKLKGRSKKALVFEIFEDNPKEVVAWKQSTIPVLEKLISMELEGRFDECLSITQNLIARCPQHTLKKDLLMDRTLLILAAKLEEKIKLLESPESKK